MTRSRFLKLLAAVPVARIAAQSPAPRPNRPAPQSGALLVVCGGTRPRVLLDGSEIATGKRTPAIFAPDRRMAFLAFVAHPLEDQWQSYLTTVDFTNGCATADYPYPGTLSSRGVSMALSADGHRLYTLTGREHAGRRSTNEGGVHAEMAVIYTFDLQKSQFLPQGTESPYEFVEGMTIIPDAGTTPPMIGPFTTGAFEPVTLAPNGLGWWRQDDKHAKAMAAGSFQVVLSSDRTSSFCIMANGDVYRMSQNFGKRLDQGHGGVDALAGDRVYGEATASGDGRLLFLPSGPTRKSDVYRFQYMDRIAVYRCSDLRKLREQSLQRPLRFIRANQDGSQLYATGAIFNQISILDAETLWQERTMDFANSSVENLAFIP
jgi:hypothetical protein